MVTLEMTYSEIIDSNVTGVQATIYDDTGRVVARFRNFDPEAGEVYGNQTERFGIPTVKWALLLLQSNKEYHQIPLTEEDLQLNANISVSSDASIQKQISIHHEAPVSLNVKTGEVEIPKDWPAESGIVKQDTMSHYIVNYEQGTGEFGVASQCLISTNGEVWKAIESVFSQTWGYETIQHFGDKYRWFDGEEECYIKIESMNPIKDDDANVLMKYIKHHKISLGPVIRHISNAWDDLSMHNVQEFLNNLRNEFPTTPFYFYDVESERFNEVGLLASSHLMTNTEATAWYVSKLSENYAESCSD